MPNDSQRGASSQAARLARPAAPLTAVFLLPAYTDLGIPTLPSFARKGPDYNTTWETFTFLLNFDGFMGTGGITADIQCSHMKLGPLDHQGEYKEPPLWRTQAHRSPHVLGDQPQPKPSLMAHPGPRSQPNRAQPLGAAVLNLRA